MWRIDLNCDVGEGAAQDAELMPFITSANIACGAHAGDETMMQATMELAIKHGVALGAHPGFADRENFGRIERAITPAEAVELVRPQILKFQEIAAQLGTSMQHVKLHGVLYNLVSRDRHLAEAIVQLVKAEATKPLLYVLAGSELERVARGQGDIAVVSEVFADRTYQPDGSLTPRSQADALITNVAEAVAQVMCLIREGKVRATNGREVRVKADTICLHGDSPHAVSFARNISAELRAGGIDIRRPVG